MKKITSFVAVLMLMMVNAPLFAQTEGCLPELKGKQMTLTGGFTEEMVPGTWYLLYQNRTQGSSNQGDGYMYDKELGGKIYKSDLNAVNDGDVTDEKACYLVRLIAGEGVNTYHPSYYIQFGTGNYVGVDLLSVETQDEAQLFNVDLVAATPGHYWFLTDAEEEEEGVHSGQRLDNNGPNSGIGYWETGYLNNENGDIDIRTDENCLDRNYDWQFYEVEFTEADEKEIMLTKVTNRCTELYDYYDAFTPGTEPGQYDPAAVQAFQNALDEATNKLEDPDWVDACTIQDLQDLLDKMNNAYAAVLKSQVKYQPANGYYFVRPTLDFTETINDSVVSVPKGMYATLEGYGCWGTLDETTKNASFLWRFDLDETTGNYKVYNAGTDGRFKQVTASTAAQLSATLDPVESEIQIFYKGRDEDKGINVVALRRADQSGDYQFIHQGNHQSGAGKSGNLVGWTQDAGASSWWMDLVDDATALQLIEAYGPVKERTKLIAAYDSIKAVAKSELAIAEDLTIEKDNFLVTDASQLYSEFTDPTEGAIEYAVDGDYTTFWHSTWQGGSVPNGTHYLQFNLNEPLSGGVAMYYVRRDVAADQSLRFSVYASETGEGDKSAWTKLGECSFNDNRTVKVPVYSNGFMFTGEYSHFRAYMEESTNNRGYWHCAEMNLVPVIQNPNCQAAHMGNLYTDLKYVLNEQEEVISDSVTLEQYNDLKTALDAFNTKFVDPTALRNAISDAEGKIAVVTVGTDPGYWSASASTEELTTLIGNAQTYDASGDYTPAQSEQYIKNITDGAETLVGQAIKIQTNKWYQFCFPTEDMYDEHEWDKAGAEEKTDTEDGHTTMYPLFGKVVALGINPVNEYGVKTPESITTDDARQSQSLIYLDPADLESGSEDLSWFRFVNVGDSAYAIQNKATGLFVTLAPAGWGTAAADLQPSTVNQKVIGYGINLLRAQSIDGTDRAYLHAQHAGCQLCCWDASTLGCNSMLMIHEVGDVDAEPTMNFKKNVEAGKVYTSCYATEYTAGEGGKLYDFKGINVASDTAVVLTSIQTATAGRPVVYIADGDYEDQSGAEEIEYEVAEFTRGAFAPVAAPDTTLAANIRGTFGYGNTVAKGMILPFENRFKITTVTSTTVAANTACMKWDGIVEAGEGDIRVSLKGKGTDAIQDVLSTVAQSGKIYSIDGKLLQQNGNINNVAKFGKGLYIVNGVKVLVK